MPRNGAGTYTLPAGNPVVAGTTIDTTWANPTMTDIASEVTNSLDRSGRGAMLAALQAFDGLVGAPGITWATESSMGFYRIGAAQMGVSVSGTLLAKWTAGQYSVALGAVGAPSYSIIGDLTSGWWSPSAGIWAWSAAGAEKLRLNAAGGYMMDVQGTIRGTGGEASASGYGLRLLNSTSNGGGSITANAGVSGGLAISSDAGPTNFSANGGPKAVLNNASFTITVPDSTSLIALSGSLVKYADMGVGRTGSEGGLGVCGQINNFFNNTLVGDIAVHAGSNVWIGTTGAASLNFVTNALGRGGVDSAGRLWGSASHNNASGMAGTAQQFFGSGTYTPTLTNVANIPAPTARKAQWIRVGNVVHVTGMVDTGALSAGASTVTTLGISLPIASNLGVVYDLAGSANLANSSWTTPLLQGNAAADRAELGWVASSTTNSSISYSFSYEVL